MIRETQDEKPNSYAKLTPYEWYQSTGEYVTSNTRIVYDNEYGGELIIDII